MRLTALNVKQFAMDLLAKFSGAWRCKEVKERGDKLKCSIAKVELLLERRIGTGMDKETGGGAGLEVQLP